MVYVSREHIKADVNIFIELETTIDCFVKSSLQYAHCAEIVNFGNLTK